MSILSRKKSAPTLAERQAGAEALAASSLTVFHTTAADLEQAADELTAIAAEAEAEAEEILLAADAEASHRWDVADAALSGASEHRTAATRIRELLGLTIPEPIFVGDAIVIESDSTDTAEIPVVIVADAEATK